MISVPSLSAGRKEFKKTVIGQKHGASNSIISQVGTRDNPIIFSKGEGGKSKPRAKCHTGRGRHLHHMLPCTNGRQISP